MPLADRPATGPALAVVVKGYPRLSETFIAQELLALQSRGLQFDIWSLRAPYDDVEHPMHAQIAARRRYLPDYLRDAPLRVLRGWRKARRMPGFAAAQAAWRADLARDRSRNRVRRWGQALVLAAELPAGTRFLYAHFLHTPASVARYAGMIRGIGWGVSAHAKDIWTIPDWEKRDKLAEAAFAVTCTASGAAHLAGLASERGRVCLAYHGLDLARFPPPPERGPQSGAFRLISVGRLVAKKGYPDLIDALARLPETLDWQFTHIGGGPEKEKLSAQAEALGLTARITWMGKRDQAAVIAALRAADLFVLPSRIAADGDRDGLPNVLMEAASQRLPILSTAVSAIPEFLEDGVHGRLVAPDDPAALAEAIAGMAADPAGRARLARTAFDRLREEFGMNRGIDLLEERLRAGLGTAPKPATSAAVPALP
ncbi:MAG: glycosyltransferase family 4 protein [Pseudomonadota bacterium]